MGNENLRKWSRDAFRELEALEMRDAERAGRECCLYWRNVRRRIRKMESYYPVDGPAGDIRFCPTCGRELQ